MKKKLELEDDDHELEILKAVAQAWYGHSGRSRPTNEFDAHRRNFESQPSRFRLEAMNMSSSSANKETGISSANWDFGQSLWDSYELVTVSKKLEAGLSLDNPFSGLDDPVPVHRRRRESKNSLRNLFNRFSSRRFHEGHQVPRGGDTQFWLISAAFIRKIININLCVFWFIMATTSRNVSCIILTSAAQKFFSFIL